MNISPRFRYYVAFALLTLLGLAVRVQRTTGPEGVGAPKEAATVAQVGGAAPAYAAQ